MWWVTFIYQFMRVEPFLHLWSEASLTIVDSLFDVVFYLVFKYFVENFCICVHRGYWLIILCFFLIGSLCSLGVRVIMALLKELGNVPSVFILQNNLRSVDILSFEGLVEFLMKSIWHFPPLEVFTLSILQVVMGLFK